MQNKDFSIQTDTKAATKWLTDLVPPRFIEQVEKNFQPVSTFQKQVMFLVAWQSGTKVLKRRQTDKKGLLLKYYY